MRENRQRGFCLALAAGLLWYTPGATVDPTSGAVTHGPVTQKVAGCSSWTLDGYRLGMADAEILAIRPATIQVPGQGQIVVKGRFSGVVVVDPAAGLVKWEATYQNVTASALRAAIRDEHGEPVSDVISDLSLPENPTMHQRRTTWKSDACDAAIIVYENKIAGGGSSRTGSATLLRASDLPKSVSGPR